MSFVITASVVVFYTCIANYGWTYADQIVEYIYHTQHLTWNEARNVCLSNGGDLAKIDSREVLDTLSRLSQEYYPDEELLYKNNVWLGLVKRLPARTEWVNDCSELNFTSNYVDTNNDNELCFRIKSGANLLGEHKNCKDKVSFLCERRKDGSCRFKEVFQEVELINVIGPITGPMDYQACETKCAIDNWCTGFYFVTPSTCQKLGNNSINQPIQLVTIRTKNCGVEFVKNETSTDEFTDDAEFPKYECSVLPEVSTIATSSVTLTSSTASSSAINPTPTLTVIPVCLSQVLTSVSTVSAPCPSTSTHVPITTPICSPQVMTMVTTVATTGMCTPTPLSSYTCPPEPCSLNSTVKLTPEELQEVLEIAEEISKNLTVDAKKMSSHLRSLVSASDHRKTSVTVGTIGVACILVPVVLVVIADLRRFYVDLRGLIEPSKVDKKVLLDIPHTKVDKNVLHDTNPAPDKQPQKHKQIYIA